MKLGESMSAHSRPLKNGTPSNLYPATVIATDTTTNGSTFMVPVHANQLIAVSTVSSRTDGTFTTTIQHSPDGVTWYTWKAGSAQSTNASVLIHDVTIPNFIYVRASILSATVTTGATVAVSLYYGTQR